MSLLFYTAANRKYELFTPIYIYFALRSNPDSYVEVGLEDAELYKKENEEAIEILHDEFGDQFKLTTVDFEDVLPGAVRFITEPALAGTCNYIYIGDIDILIFDGEIRKSHLKNMSQHEAPFSNIIRGPQDTENGNYRLSGLHFAPTDIQYPLPDLSGIDYSMDNPVRGADENVLYEIMKKQRTMISRDMSYRPEHGIHMRRFGHPFGRRSGWRGPKLSYEEISNNNQVIPWSGLEREDYRQSFRKALQEESFQDLYFHLDIRARNLIAILENACAGRFEEFEKEAYMYIISGYINQHLIRRKLSHTFIGTLYRKISGELSHMEFTRT